MTFLRYSDTLAGRFGVSREEQDAFALSSHRKAEAARKRGDFKAEIVPLGDVRDDGGKYPLYAGRVQSDCIVLGALHVSCEYS
jgi:acetyl-CoA acetyltransferase